MQAPIAGSPRYTPPAPGPGPRRNVQDVRQSIYDVPYAQRANNAEALPVRSCSHSEQEHHSALTSQAAAADDTSEAGGAVDRAHGLSAPDMAAAASSGDVVQCLAGMDVRQSMYDSPHQASNASDASQAWSSQYGPGSEMQTHHMHAESGQVMDASAASRGPFDESMLTQQHLAWDGDSWQPQQAPSDQSHDAHLDGSSHALPMRPASAGASSSQAYWEDQSELHQKPMTPSVPTHAQDAQRHQHEERDQGAQHWPSGQGAQREHQHQYAQQTQSAWQAQHAQRGQHAQRAQHSKHAALQPQHDRKVSATHTSEAQQHAGASDEAGHAHRAFEPQLAAQGHAISQEGPAFHQASRAAPDQHQTGWDLAENDADTNTSASQAYASRRSQAMTPENASSSLDSEQEAALWEMVNEEPSQDGLSVHYLNHKQQQQQHQQHERSSSRQNSRQQSEQQSSQRFPQHTPFVPSHQSSHQYSRQSSYPSSQASSAHLVSQVKQQECRPRPEHVVFFLVASSQVFF